MGERKDGKRDRVLERKIRRKTGFGERERATEAERQGLERKREKKDEKRDTSGGERKRERER